MVSKILFKPAIWFALIIPLILIIFGLRWFFVHGGILWQDLLLLVIFYELGLFGISVGSHRFFSHCSFKATTFMECVLFILASSAFQYSPLFWAAKHRKHHRFTDRPGDPHSPWVADKPFGNRLEGWIHSYFSWAFTFPFEKNMQEYAPDLLRKKHLVFLHRIHYLTGISFILIPGLIEWWMLGNFEGFLRGIFWGGLLRIFLLHNSIFLLNSFAGHGIGTRIFNLNDKSKNNVLIFPLVLGECWHHNHHASPASASLQVKWYHLDPHYYILLFLEKLHLISELRSFKVSENIQGHYE